jgi:PPOX class probable F420-dependent enzyme
MVSTNRQPSAGRPVVPDGYGIPENNDGLLPWSHVEERMTEAKNYWIATASRSAKPSVTPVWGAWVDGKLYFDGAPSTRRGKNIQQNPRISVHLESGDQVVILEGDAVILQGAPERALAEKVAEGYRAKYAQVGYSPAADQWDQGGLFEFTPQKGLAWTKFPDDMTRWIFK